MVFNNEKINKTDPYLFTSIHSDFIQGQRANPLSSKLSSSSPSWFSSFTSLSSSRASTLIGGRVTAVADWAGGVLVNQLLNKRLNIIIVIKIIVAIIVVVVLIAVVVLVVVVVIIIVNTINPKLSSPSSSS